jgi:hypothetical protein
VARRVIGTTLRAAALLAGPVLLLEAALRMAGFQPQDLQRAGFAATMDDGYTEWSMRPNVRLNEYSVTNAFGLHEDREVNLEKPAGTKRVAVVGSSVVWAIGEPLDNTIPRAMERSLAASGCDAQVLNFAAHGYNILNAAAYVQTKVHQFRPDAVVVVMDLQMTYPRFPSLRPERARRPARAIRQVGWAEALFKRASEYSVVLTWLDDTAQARASLARWVRLPPASKQAPIIPAAPDDAVTAWFAEWLAQSISGLTAPLRAKSDVAAPVVNPAPAAAPEAARTLEAHEARRERELASVVASLAAFSREMGFKLYFTTPYGPYFRATPAELSKFSLSYATRSADLYGGPEAAVRREAELASTVISRAALREGAKVVDFLPRSRAATMADGDFSSDGIHFTPQGYRRVGTMLAERLVADGFCAPKGR